MQNVAPLMKKYLCHVLGGMIGYPKGKQPPCEGHSSSVSEECAHVMSDVADQSMDHPRRDRPKWDSGVRIMVKSASGILISI